MRHYRYRKVPTVGCCAVRLKPAADNPREVAFAKRWEYENDHRGGAEPIMQGLIPDWTPRDAEVAATLIQWLGSNVGFSFVEESLRCCGYLVVPKEKAL